MLGTLPGRSCQLKGGHLALSYPRQKLGFPHFTFLVVSPGCQWVGFQREHFPAVPLGLRTAEQKDFILFLPLTYVFVTLPGNVMGQGRGVENGYRVHLRKVYFKGIYMSAQTCPSVFGKLTCWLDDQRMLLLFQMYTCLKQSLLNKEKVFWKVAPRKRERKRIRKVCVCVCV